MTILSARSGADRATTRPVGTVVRALLAFALLALMLDAISARVYAGGSDRATAILEGQAVGSGNVLLHGWILTHDSFWTIDAFFYALAVRIGGLRPGLLNLEPALAVAIAVVVGAFVASRGHRGGAAIAGAATAVVLLAFPTICNVILPARWPGPRQYGRPGSSCIHLLEAGPLRLEMGSGGRRARLRNARRPPDGRLRHRAGARRGRRRHAAKAGLAGRASRR